MRGAMRLLFIYEGYLRVAVETDMMVETSSLIWVKDGLEMCSRSTAIRFSAVLSRTTTQSAACVAYDHLLLVTITYH